MGYTVKWVGARVQVWFRVRVKVRVRDIIGLVGVRLVPF